MRWSASVFLLCVVLNAGCDEARERPLPTPDVSGPPHRCISAPRTATDLRSPPAWARTGIDQIGWTTRDGCLVRLDVVLERPGPEHCGFDPAQVIVTGLAVGERTTGDRSARVYVKDPSNRMRDPAVAGAFDADAALPADATDTGYRRTGRALWVVNGDPRAIYIVSRSVERWPLDPDPAGCF